MKIPEAMDLINEVENEFPVDRWVIDGVHIWPLVRFNLFFENHFSYKDTNLLQVNKRQIFLNVRIAQLFGMFKGYGKFIHAYLKDYKKNSKPNIPSEAIFLSDGVSYSLCGSSWYEKYCDPFINRFHEKNISCFLMSPLHNYFIPRNTDSMFIQPSLDLIRIKSEISTRLSILENINLKGFKKFIKFLKLKPIDLKIPNVFQIRSKTKAIKNLSRFYKNILKKSKSAIAFSVCYYGENGMALNLACRELNIKSVDIAHGVGGDLHVAYGRWNRMPENGYELLPSLFWCWNEYESSTIKKWNKNVTEWHKPLTGGNLFLNQWKSDYFKLQKLYDQKIDSIKKQYQGTIQVLYTLNNIDFTENKNLARLINSINASKLSCHFWVRLHPSRINQKLEVINLFKSKKTSNVEVSLATDLPLYALLKHIDIHITEYSSSVVDAESYNVPSVTIHEISVEIFPEQIKSGWAVPAYSDKEIISAIQLQLERKESLKKGKCATASLETKAFDILIGLINDDHRDEKRD